MPPDTAIGTSAIDHLNGVLTPNSKPTLHDEDTARLRIGLHRGDRVPIFLFLDETGLSFTAVRAEFVSIIVDTPMPVGPAAIPLSDSGSKAMSDDGGRLSGGEQQMLAIGRALMTNPSLLVLDEATEGLAPVIREEIWTRLKELNTQGLAMLIIDKEIDALMEFADRHYVVEKGESGAEAKRNLHPILRLAIGFDVG